MVIVHEKTIDRAYAVLNRVPIKSMPFQVLCMALDAVDSRTKAALKRALRKDPRFTVALGVWKINDG